MTSKHGYGQLAPATATVHAGPTGSASSSVWTVQVTHVIYVHTDPLQAARLTGDSLMLGAEAQTGFVPHPSPPLFSISWPVPKPHTLPPPAKPFRGLSR